MDELTLIGISKLSNTCRFQNCLDYNCNPNYNDTEKLTFCSEKLTFGVDLQ